MIGALAFVGCLAAAIATVVMVILYALGALDE
jgi:hypothetical protein